MMVDMKLINESLNLLSRWSEFAEHDWYDIPGRPGLGCYGTGYNSWGVQTNQKYVSAMATLATNPKAADLVDQSWALDRALAALRFSLASHHIGDGVCTDGTKWGRTWISSLGVERMCHAVTLLDPHLTDADRELYRNTLLDQADWLSDVYAVEPGINGSVWGTSGKNKPESNLWNGAACWRALVAAPDHEHADKWRETAHRFLINAVSVESDERDETVVAGKPICERFEGPNFFPHFSLDHHAYLNVGYMVICTSNAAMLHFDMRMQQADSPDTLAHHQRDLWQTIRRMLFSDGRLARIGGDTRVRYAYCQEYLIPAMLYAADQLGESHAATLLDSQLSTIDREAQAHNDGSFYGGRLGYLRETSPYYYTRLESDRACALAMLATYRPLAENLGDPEDAAAFEKSVEGGWAEPEHGAAVHRCASRFASFAWHASGKTQGLCTPPDDGDLAEWSYNLAGRVRFMGDDGEVLKGASGRRQVEAFTIDTFDGGFATCGVIDEGMNVVVLEGWKGSDMAKHYLAYIALPDGHSVVGLQRCVAGDKLVFTLEVKGMLLNLPNDLLNNYVRRIRTGQGEGQLKSPADRTHALPLHSDWACIDNRVGAIGIYGSDGLSVHRSRERRAGKFQSLYVDEICWHCDARVKAHQPGRTILDVGWAVASEANADMTAQLSSSAEQLELNHPTVRAVRLTAINGRSYVVVANLGGVAAEVAIDLKNASPISGPACESGKVALEPVSTAVFEIAD